MDKQTLSNYGWLVIVTLILAIMLALATPFGNYVGDAVVSVANGFVGASNKAIDEDNIAVNVIGPSIFSSSLVQPSNVALPLTFSSNAL